MIAKGVTLEINAEELKPILVRINKLPIKKEDQYDKVVDIAYSCRDYSRLSAPYDEGHLRSEIKVFKKEESGIVTVASRARSQDFPYSSYLEEGGTPHFVSYTNERLKKWAIRKGVYRKGARGLLVFRRPHPKRHYMLRGLEQIEREIEFDLTEFVNGALEVW